MMRILKTTCIPAVAGAASAPVDEAGEFDTVLAYLIDRYDVNGDGRVSEF